MDVMSCSYAASTTSRKVNITVHPSRGSYFILGIFYFTKHYSIGNDIGLTLQLFLKNILNIAHVRIDTISMRSHMSILLEAPDKWKLWIKSVK